MGEYATLGDVAGKRVLVRSDLNVPLADGDDGAKQITDDGRVRASVPTIRALAQAGARVVVVAHLGRPKGSPDPAYTLAPVATRLGELLDQPVAFAGDTVGESARSTVAGLGDGDVAVLENVRFNAGETSKDDAERGAFADDLADLADAFVSDGFGVVHRKQASVYDVAMRLPHAMGTLVHDEIEVLRRLTENPERPYVVVLGGSKVSDKLAVIDNLLGKADTLLVGGGMVFTFLAAQGHEVGASLLEADQVDTCREYLRRAEASGVDIVLPSDVVVAPEFSADASPTVVPADAMPTDQIGLDIGPDSAAAIRRPDPLRRGTVFWNGPMGVFEFDAFAAGTRAVAQALTEVDEPLGGRWWRLRGRRAPPRLRGRRLRPHLDRRRCQPGVPRGHDPAGRRGPRVLSPTAGPGRDRSVVRPPAPHPREEPMAPAARTPLMAGNWKMNLNHQEAVVLVQKLAWTLNDKKHDYGRVEVVVVPPFTDLRGVQTLVDGDRLQIRYGAQDVSPHDDGAHTGDISVSMLAKLGCSYVVVGHSERRDAHHEDDALVNAKARKAPRCLADADRVRRGGPRGASGGASRRARAGPGGGVLGRHRRRPGRRPGPGLRAGLGHRHRRGGDPGRRAGGLRRDPEPDRRAALGADRRSGADPVRRVGQGRQRRGDHEPARRGRVPGRRGQPPARRVRGDLPVLRHACPRMRAGGPARRIG